MTSSLINQKETRKFGIIAFFFFGSFAGISIWRQHETLGYFFETLCLLGLLLFLLPKQLWFLHKGWLKVGHFIGTLITMLIMTFAFYIIITPATFLKKIFGGPPISLKPDKKCRSYWIDRTEPLQPKERFINRY
jgi:hypothetical protein